MPNKINVKYSILLFYVLHFWSFIWISQVTCEEECGDGFNCVFDQRIIAYGCAPVSNLSATICCRLIWVFFRSEISESHLPKQIVIYRFSIKIVF